MFPSRRKEGGQGFPDFSAARVTLENDVIDQPRLKVPAPCPNVDFDPVALDVRPGGQDQRPFGDGPHFPGFAAFVKALPIRRFALFLPCFA